MDKEEYSDKISTLLGLLDEGVRIQQEIFESNPAPKVFIYGAGNFGTMMYRNLQEKDYNIEAFLDRKGGKDILYNGKLVLRAEDSYISEEEKKKSIVLICICLCESSLLEIKNWLLKLGYGSVYIFGVGVCWKLRDNQVVDHEAKGKIIETSTLFEDSLSQDIYYNYIGAVVNPYYNKFSDKVSEIQYFDNSVPFEKGFSRFIDGGAFDGDTVRELVKQYGKKVEAIACFEPNNKLADKLIRSLRKESLAELELVFPCGLWDKMDVLLFDNQKSQGGGIISDYGDAFIQCMSIDECLWGFNPTFLKMDIEGAELKALEGAKNTIRKNKPDMAICVYHNFDHIWEIPLLIRQIDKNYRFYLRTYTDFGVETVLYAVSNN